MSRRISSSAAEHTPSARRARAEDVARLVFYFDVFRHPLRRDELAALGGADIDPAIESAVARGWVEADGRHVWRRGHGADRARREARSVEAERQWRRARRAAAWLSHVPFVRGVLVTGGLSKASAGPDGDVDFMLLVEPARVWTVKAALHGLRRVLPETVRESLCTNYLLSTDALALPQRSMFHAVELATAVPMAGPAECAGLLDANPWAEAFVPGLEFSRRRARAAPPIGAHPGVEAAIPPRLETLGARVINDLWERRYGWLPAPERARRFQRGAGVATNHLHDYSAWVNDEFLRRCAEVGVPGLAPA